MAVYFFRMQRVWRVMRETHFVNIESSLGLLQDLKRAELEKYKSHESVVNAMVCIQLSIIDLMTVVDAVLCTSHVLEKRVHARHAAVIIAELFEDAPALLGRDLRAHVASLPDIEEVVRRLGEHGKRFTLLVKLYGDDLCKVRNSVLAHRTPDAAAQLEMLSSMDPGKIIRIAYGVFDWWLELKKTEELITKALNKQMQMERASLQQQVAQGGGERGRVPSAG